ncbi:single-stranded-DNA-specific exonuclease RecJ [Candidatus Sumerlaeota bacterium]|nr:single-stranded-DNA-specific exonuclease RecJ [Candidatus Sumerlaeota bacterium]
MSGKNGSMPSSSETKYQRMLRKQWEIQPARYDWIDRLQMQMGLPSVVAKILSNRGYDTIDKVEEFLDCSLAKLNNPFLLKDMDKAVKRIRQAMEQKQKILIYGDYDADGTTSTAILMRMFRFLEYDRAEYYVPHRLLEGYGLNRDTLQRLLGRDIGLIVTVDNGISANDAVDLANARGVQMVITDHHQPASELPNAIAVVDPARPDCNYPFKTLAGCGVAYKLVHAMLRELNIDEKKARGFLFSLLDLVALGTVADIVPIQGENRSIVKHGLERLSKSTKPGVQALLRVAGCENRPMTAGIISFFLTPRLNAAGRMDHASLAVDLMTTDDPAEAERLALRLDELNAQRRELEQEILLEAQEAIHKQCNLDEQKIIVIAGKNWHLGVIGIVASRILEQYHCPVVILSIEDTVAKGSARSLAGFDIHDALSKTQNLLLSFGGHRMAAGLKIETAHINDLRRDINKVVENMPLLEETLPKLLIDAEVTPEELTVEDVQAIRMLAPFGCSNPEPLLMMAGMELQRDPIVVGNNHLKLRLGGLDMLFDAIGFSLGDWMEEFEQGCRNVEIVFSPSISTWGGSPKVELEIKAIRGSR